MAVQKGRKIDDNRCSGLDGKIPPAPRSDQIAWFVEFPALELKKIEGGKDNYLWYTDQSYTRKFGNAVRFDIKTFLFFLSPDFLRMS